MKKIFQCLILLGVLQVGFAEEARPSVDSIKKLMAVTRSQSLFENTFEQMNQYIQNTMGQQFADLGENEEKEQLGLIMAQIREEFNWEIMEAMYLDIYAQSFSQSEIDSMLSFYETEGGQAILNKMPVLMQNIMSHMQTQMQNVLSKIEELQETMD